MKKITSDADALPHVQTSNLEMMSSSFSLACYVASAVIILIAGPPDGKSMFPFIFVPLMGPLLIALLGDASPIFDSSLASLSVAAIYEAGTPVEVSLLSGLFMFSAVAFLVVSVYEVTNRPALVSTIFMAITCVVYGDFQGSRWRMAGTAAILVFNYFMLRFSAAMAPEQRKTLANTVRLVIFIVSVDMVLKGLTRVSCGYLLALPDVIWLFTIM